MKCTSKFISGVIKIHFYRNENELNYDSEQTGSVVFERGKKEIVSINLMNYWKERNKSFL